MKKLKWPIVEIFLMKKTVLISFITGILVLLLISIISAQSVDYKFIRTFLCRVGGSELSAGDEVLMAKFELVIVGRHQYNKINGNTWGAIKAINPNTEIYLYQASRPNDNQDNASLVDLRGLGRWNISRGHSMGNLNINNSDLFLLDSKSNRIYTPAYPFSWIADFGSKDYQNYWLEGTIHDLVSQPWTADGVFVDVCVSIMTNTSSTPVKYNTASKWSLAMNNYCNNITAGLHNENQKVLTNRGSSRHIDGYNAWIALDASSTPPDAVLEEGAFAALWGSGDVLFYSEDHWKKQVDLMAQIHNSKLVYQSHSNLDEGESGTDNYGEPVDFWDILWYAMCSYHIGKNTVDNNSYFGFSESYNKVIWYDEFDYIDLGKATGSYQVTNYAGSNIYWRKFEKGYVYINPTKNYASNISLPETCKWLNHNNFKNNPATIPDVNTINLDAHRGTILLNSIVTH